MRTTVTLDPDTESLVRRLMAERGIGFKQALNDAIRAGAGGDAAPSGKPTRVRSLGRPTVDLDRALQVAGDLEDAEITRDLTDGR
ncbi:antitoxin [Nocardioides massiliensis]|uniref:Antitoxin n=1 Tax=Nocardioides massiliensis TaxID=1325935 RepID=A0ABT9NSG2_9ACTN|nr:antitoxin [Nocardioides massiliensis]MDP9822975.1 hypothetical protein [Nocardioides massiliensis]